MFKSWFCVIIKLQITISFFILKNWFMTFLLVNYIFPLPKKKIAMFLQEKDIFIFPFVSAKNIFFFLHILYTSKFMLTFICVSNFTRRQRTLGRNLNIRKKADNTWGFFKFFFADFRATVKQIFGHLSHENVGDLSSFSPSNV